MMAPATREEIAPQTVPSTVLCGMTSGASLCLPKRLPPKSAKLSHTQVDMQAMAKTGIQMLFSISASLYIIIMGTRGYASTPRLAKAPGARTLLDTTPAVMTANTATKNRVSQMTASALSQIATALATA